MITVSRTLRVLVVECYSISSLLEYRWQP